MSNHKNIFEKILCGTGYHDKKFVERNIIKNENLYICNRCYLQWTERI